MYKKHGGERGLGCSCDQTCKEVKLCVAIRLSRQVLVASQAYLPLNVDAL